MRLSNDIGFCLLLACATASWAQEPVKVFANWRQPPKSYVGADGVLQGYAIETARAVLDEAGIAHEFVPLPYPRAFERTRHCEGLMVGVFKTAERESFLAFSQPIVSDRVALVTRAGDPPVQRIPQDLQGKSVTYLSGAAFGIDPKSLTGARLDQQASFELMVRKLMAHRTDAIIISPQEGVALAAHDAGVPMERLRIAAQPLAVVPNHIVACKSDARLAALLERIDQALAHLRATGRMH